MHGAAALDASADSPERGAEPLTPESSPGRVSSHESSRTPSTESVQCTDSDATLSDPNVASDDARRERAMRTKRQRTERAATERVNEARLHKHTVWPTSVQQHPPLHLVDDEADDASAWAHAPPWCNAEYAVLRPTPLSSINQGIVDDLQVIRMQRRLTGAVHSEMAYMRAAAAVKAVPFSLHGVPPAHVARLKGVGRKMSILIEQFFSAGAIHEAAEIRRDAAVQQIREFSELLGIGPGGALRAYQDGCRSLDEAARWRGTWYGIAPAENVRLHRDLAQRIPRAAVAEISHEITRALQTHIHNAVSTLCGSYRRGAVSSGDIDVVCSGPGEPRSVLAALLAVLAASATVTLTHTLGIGGHDGVSVANVIVRHGGIHRRVDIVYARPSQYGAAVLGWTGGVLYERDLRRWAQARGLKVRVC